MPAVLLRGRQAESLPAIITDYRLSRSAPARSPGAAFVGYRRSQGASSTSCLRDTALHLVHRAVLRFVLRSLWFRIRRRKPPQESDHQRSKSNARGRITDSHPQGITGPGKDGLAHAQRDEERTRDHPSQPFPTRIEFVYSVEYFRYFHVATRSQVRAGLWPRTPTKKFGLSVLHGGIDCFRGTTNAGAFPLMREATFSCSPPAGRMRRSSPLMSSQYFSFDADRNRSSAVRARFTQVGQILQCRLLAPRVTYIKIHHTCLKNALDRRSRSWPYWGNEEAEDVRYCNTNVTARTACGERRGVGYFSVGPASSRPKT